MSDLNDWIIECENCGRNYDIPKEIPSNFQEIDNREQLVLEASPKCPFCHSINNSIPRWK